MAKDWIDQIFGFGSKPKKVKEQKSKKNLGGGLTGYKTVQTRSDGSKHVTNSLSSGLRRSYDVSKSGKISKDHFSENGKKKRSVNRG